MPMRRIMLPTAMIVNMTEPYFGEGKRLSVGDIPGVQDA